MINACLSNAVLDYYGQPAKKCAKRAKILWGCSDIWLFQTIIRIA